MSTRRLIGALVASVGLLAFAVTPASAVIVKLSSGKYLSYLPVRSERLQMSASQTAQANLDYGGGPVMPANANYAFYWRPDTGPSYPPDYSQGSTSTSPTSPTTAALRATSTRWRPS